MGQSQSTTSLMDEESIRKEVKRFPVVIFTLPRCPYCVKAKQLLDSERIEYKENNLNAYGVCYAFINYPNCRNQDVGLSYFAIKSLLRKKFDCKIVKNLLLYFHIFIKSLGSSFIFSMVFQQTVNRMLVH